MDQAKRREKHWKHNDKRKAVDNEQNHEAVVDDRLKFKVPICNVIRNYLVVAHNVGNEVVAKHYWARSNDRHNACKKEVLW